MLNYMFNMIIENLERGLFMVKVNLEYNPYIMDFKAKFNGKEPHINSSVERYARTPLQMWINDLPHMLYDEMNGYDFDLEFIGPDLEYDDIVASFINVGVSSDDVRCIHVKSMESRIDKLKRIQELCDWLDNNTNARLDLNTFKMENQDVFENSHSIVIIGDSNLGDFQFENANVSIEIISNLQELDSTELKNIPIIIDAERMSIQDFQNTLIQITQDNSEVSHEQFFVYIRVKAKFDVYKRLLVDIGFKDTNIINNLNDSSLKKYFEYYPISDFIRNYLSVIRNKVDELKAEMDEEKEASDKANGEVMSQIMMIEEHISVIKDAIVSLDNLSKTTIIPEWDFTINKMIETINAWKIKKTKITTDDEAVTLAGQFEEEVKYQWTKFIESITDITIKNKNSITSQCTEIYDKATRSQSPKYHCNTNFDSYKSSFDGLKIELLKIKEQSYEKPKDNILNAFLKEIAATNDNKEAVLVTTYPCQKWREYVVEYTTSIIGRIIRERNSEIQQYCSDITMNFMDKLIKLLDEREEDKENFSNRLSADIRVLQKDRDWLNAFIDNLETIERS